MLKRFNFLCQSCKLFSRVIGCCRNTSSHSFPRSPDPPSPELCCMSGCANCVWIEYAKELRDYYKDGNQAINEALKKIEDPSFRSFIKIEIEGQLSKTKT